MIESRPYRVWANGLWVSAVALFVAAIMAGAGPVYGQLTVHRWASQVDGPAFSEVSTHPWYVQLTADPLFFKTGTTSESDPSVADWPPDDEQDDGDQPIDLGIEVVFSFRYAGLVTSDLSVRYVGHEAFIPLGELFSILRVNWRFDRGARVVEGFFVSENTEYRLDFRRDVATVDGNVFPIDETGYLIGERDVYVRPDVLQDLFGLRASVDVNELAVYLRSDTEMPVERDRRRERERPLLTDPYDALRHAPLVYDRRRKTLGGGALDYGISVHQTVHDLRLNAQTSLGAEVFGGDLEWSGRIGVHDRAFVAHDYFRWRYVDGDAPYVRQVRVGDLSSTGLRSVPYRGVHFTNQQATAKKFFGEYHVSGEIEPGWELELYMDDQLVGLADADAAGTYQFSVPLVYGTSMLRIRAFGPMGEVRDQWRRIQIPFSMLPDREMQYNVHLGRDVRRDAAVAQADVGYGISEHVTAKAGIETLPSGRPTVYGTVTSRLMRHYLTSLSLSPGGLQELSLNGFFPSNAQVQLRYAQFNHQRSYLFDDRQRRISASVFLPLTLQDRRASLRMETSRTTVGDRHVYGLRTFANVSHDRIQIYLQTRSDWSSEYRRTRVSPSFSYAVTRSSRTLRHLRGALLSARAHYETSRRRFDTLELNLAQNIMRGTRLQVLAQIGFGGARTSLGFRLSSNLDFAQTTTDARLQSGQSRVVHSIRGSIAHDRHNDRFLFQRRSAVGRSAAALRMFVDRNGNGRLDADEQVIPQSAVRLERSSSVSKRQDGSVTHVSDLSPYEQYTARVDEASIANPLWVPARESFSFIADPNAVKPIDVPLFAAGVVQGAVLENRSGRQVPVPGIRVRLIHVESGRERLLRTFSDGTFYEMGLAPGTYEASVDADQLAAYDLQLRASSKTFLVRATEEGDFIDGIRFIVEAETSEPDDDAIASTEP